MSRTLSLLLPLLAVACTTEEDVITPCCAATAVDTTVLTHFVACSDTSFHAWNDDDTIGLSVWMPGLLNRADGGDHAWTGRVGELDTTATWELGTQLSTAYCSDVISAVVTESYQTGFGTLDVSVTAPSGVAGTATGTLNLSDIEFHGQNGEALGIQSFSFGELQIVTNWGG